jgi:carbohydrate-selective porin OprB
LSGRESDVVGIGVAHADLSDRVRNIEGRTFETALECFYRLQLMPWMSVQPDIHG